MTIFFLPSIFFWKEYLICSLLQKNEIWCIECYTYSVATRSLYIPCLSLSHTQRSSRRDSVGVVATLLEPPPTKQRRGSLQLPFREHFFNSKGDNSQSKSGEVRSQDDPFVSCMRLPVSCTCRPLPPPSPALFFLLDDSYFPCARCAAPSSPFCFNDLWPFIFNLGEISFLCMVYF